MLVLRVAISLIIIAVVVVAAIFGYNAIDSLPLRQDMMGQIVEGCLRAADIAIAGAIAIVVFRRALA